VYFDFSKTLPWNISHSKKNSPRYDQKRISVCCMISAHYSCNILIKTEISRKVFEKYWIIKYQNSSFREFCEPTYDREHGFAKSKLHVSKLRKPTRLPLYFILYFIGTRQKALRNFKTTLLECGITGGRNNGHRGLWTAIFFTNLGLEKSKCRPEWNYTPRRKQTGAVI
jgi:hypothetical protein